MSGLATILWQVPSALWFLPLALLPLLLGSRSTRTIASTAPWHAIGARSSRRRRIWHALLVLAVVAAAGKPIFLDTPEPTLDERKSEPVARVTRVGRRAVLDLDLEAEPIAPASEFDRSRVSGRVVDAAGRVWFEGLPSTPTSIPLPDALAGTRVSVIFADGSHEARIPIDVPSLLPPPRVVDASGDRSVARALAALEKGGRITLAHGEPSVESPVDITITTFDRDAPPGSTEPGLRIEIPAGSVEATRFLLAPDRASEGGFAQGLDTRRWTIFEAVDLGAGGVVRLRDSTGAPLVSEERGLIRFAFRPERSDLADHLGWPVFLGRAIDRLAPIAYDVPPPSPAPTLFLVGIALLCLTLAVGTARARVLLAAALLASFALPTIERGRAPRSEFVANGGAPIEELTDAIDRLPGGGTLVVAATSDPPLEFDELATRLAARHVSLEVAPLSPPRLRAGRSPVALGEPVFLEGPPEAKITVHPPASDAADRTRIEETTLDAEGTLTHRPNTPGAWIYRLKESPERDAVVVIVAPPIEVRPIGPASTGVLDLFEDAKRWRVLEMIAADDDSFSDRLPTPERGLVIWDGARAEHATERTTVALEEWIAAGGTLFAVAAPPFRGEERDLPLDRVLPEPLPPSPRPPARDHGVLLLDLSGSMSDTALETLWTSLTTLLRGLPPDDRWAIAGFREEVRWILPPGAPIDADALARVRETLTTRGGTRLDRALAFAAAAIESDPTLAPTVLVLTDGRTSGAGWEAITERLRDQSIEVSALAIGSAIDDTVLAPLVTATGGSWAQIPDPETAVDELAELLAPRDDLWSETVPPVTAVDPNDPRWPESLVTPSRVLADDPHSGGSATVAWSDRSGAPLLLERTLGRGRTLLLRTGLDEESFPPGPAADRARALLAASLAETIARTPAARRTLEVGLDRAGRPWTAIERLPGDPPRVSAELSSPTGKPIERTTALLHLGRYHRAGSIAPGASLSVAGTRTVPFASLETLGARTWSAWEGRLPRGSDAVRWSSASAFLVGLAAVIALRPLAEHSRLTGPA